MNILTVCTGNICRSVLSCHLLAREARTRGLDWITVTSAGTRAQPWYRIYGILETILRDVEFDVSGHEATRITADMIKTSDLILVMTYEHRDDILTLAPDASEKVRLLKEFAGLDGDPEIQDPLGHPDKAYYACFELICEAVEKVIDRLEASRQA